MKNRLLPLYCLVLRHVWTRHEVSRDPFGEFELIGYYYECARCKKVK